MSANYRPSNAIESPETFSSRKQCPNSKFTTATSKGINPYQIIGTLKYVGEFEPLTQGKTPTNTYVDPVEIINEHNLLT
jgi:hypothetical protein